MYRKMLKIASVWKLADREKDLPPLWLWLTSTTFWLAKVWGRKPKKLTGTCITESKRRFSRSRNSCTRVVMPSTAWSGWPSRAEWPPWPCLNASPPRWTCRRTWCRTRSDSRETRRTKPRLSGFLFLRGIFCSYLTRLARLQSSQGFISILFLSQIRLSEKVSVGGD